MLSDGFRRPTLTMTILRKKSENCRKSCWAFLFRRSFWKKHSDLVPTSNNPYPTRALPTWKQNLLEDEGTSPTDRGNMAYEWYGELSKRQKNKQLYDETIRRYFTPTLTSSMQRVCIRISRPRERRSVPVRSQNSTRSSGDPPGPPGGSGDDPDPDDPPTRNHSIERLTSSVDCYGQRRQFTSPKLNKRHTQEEKSCVHLRIWTRRDHGGRTVHNTGQKISFNVSNTNIPNSKSER